MKLIRKTKWYSGSLAFRLCGAIKLPETQLISSSRNIVNCVLRTILIVCIEVTVLFDIKKKVILILLCNILQIAYYMESYVLFEKNALQIFTSWGVKDYLKLSYVKFITPRTSMFNEATFQEILLPSPSSVNDYVMHI